MRALISLVSQLTDDDVQWILSAGTAQQLAADTELIAEGREIPAIYVVLEGLLGVFATDSGGRRLALVGPGEIVGEMSFLERRAPTESVKAIETTMVLVLPRPTLEAKLAGDVGFSSRFHIGLAKLLSQRLRAANAHLRAQTPIAIGEESGPWAPFGRVIRQFKGLMKQVDAAALKNDGEVPAELSETVRAQFQKMAVMLNDGLGDCATLNERTKEEFGIRIQHELLPYLHLTENADRWYSKPRGYAGDFLSIDFIYQNRAGGSGRLGPLLDRCFLDLPAAVAVRNRRGVLGREIGEAIAAKGGAPAQVTSLASGPAQELFDVFAGLPDPMQLKVHLVDMDLQALAFVADKRDKLRLSRRMITHNENVIFLALGRKQLELANQDLVYSIGLIDYFGDDMVVRLLSWIHGILAPGGRVILGNFHPANPTKALMDHVLEWKLIHRTEEDMDRLYTRSLFGRPSTAIRWEEQRINLFAECVKR